MNAVENLKSRIKSVATEKAELSKGRREYKVSTRGSVPEMDRQAHFSHVDRQKADLRWTVRHLLLAYALVRGRAYTTQESVCRRGDPSCAFVAQLATECGRETSENDVVTWWTGEEKSVAA